MKRIEWVLSFGLLLLALFAVNAYAESPREEFRQMVEQLQQSPGDTALRERIIKQAQAMRPAPELPTEAKRRMGRGQAAFEMAKSPADYQNAIAEFTAASNAAPWVADIYYNLGTIHEKAGKPTEAMANFKLYLMAAPAAQDYGEVEQRIFKLEYAAEQTRKEQEAKQREDQARQKVQNLVDELNRRYSGKSFWYSKICVPPGQKIFENHDPCNSQERHGTNWHRLKNSDRPEVLSFSLTSDGKIQFFTGFPDPSYEGTALGSRVEDIQWKSISIAGLNRKPPVRIYTEPVWIKMDYSGEWYQTCNSDGDPDDRPSERISCMTYTRE